MTAEILVLGGGQALNQGRERLQIAALETPQTRGSWSETTATARPLFSPTRARS
jgi:hypothetical protein